MAFIEAQSGTYANFLFSSFPLIRRRAILDKSFAAFLRRSLPYRRIRPPGGRARWGVVQLVGHLTVNEDGEGSNPSAPAKFLPIQRDKKSLRLSPSRSAILRRASPSSRRPSIRRSCSPFSANCPRPAPSEIRR